MGWAKNNIGVEQRRAIARELFQVVEESGDQLNGHCPFHEDSSPSFGYNAEEDAFCCLANCSDPGDLIELYTRVNGLDKKRGFKSFVDVYGEGKASSGPLKAQRNGASSKAEGPLIPESVLDNMPPLSEDWLQEFERVRGWSRGVIAKLGIRVQTQLQRKSGELSPISTPYRVALPVRDATGKLRNIRVYRRPGSNVQKKIMNWGKGYGTARVFPPPNLIGQSGVMLLTEGEPDAICAMSKGFPAATLTANNVRNWRDDQLAPFRQRDVVICYDADKAGQKAADIAAGNLVKVAKSVRILVWPDFMGVQDDGEWPDDHGQDLTDYFCTHGKTPNDFQELFSAARVFEKPAENKAKSSEGYAQFGEWGERGWKFKPRLLADRLISDLPLLYEPSTGKVYRYNGQYYEPFEEDQIKRVAIDYLQTESTQSRVNDAAFQAKVMSTIAHGREVNDRHEWVCLQNLMLNIEDGTTAPHDPDYLSTVQLGVTFNPDSGRKCERWIQFLEETIQTPEAILQLQEFFGYCLTRSTAYDKCLLLWGPGSDGKSKVVHVLRHLVGEANCSAVRFQDLGDQFQRAALYNRQLNTSTEISNELMESDMFKALVTGDPIQASFKHKDVFEFEPFVKMVFATNELPRTRDNSHGYYRRWLPISFKRQFVQGVDADPNLKAKLMSELSEIFEWALAGLSRLREQGSFTWCEETDELLGLYKRQNNPVQVFVEDRCVLSEPNKVAPKDELYAAYRKFAKRFGYKQKNKENFCSALKAVVNQKGMYLEDTRPSLEGRRVYCFKGISLLQSACAEDDNA